VTLTSAATTTPYVSGRRKIVLLVSLSAVLFSLLALYAAVLAVLLPNQIQLLVGSAKTTALATVFAITSVFSSIATPVAGALIGGGSLALVPYTPSLAWIIVAWIISAVALNAMQAAITTIVADRLAPAERGLASGLIGAGMTAGGTVGIIIGGMMGEHIALAYELFAGWIAVVSVIFVVLNPDRPSEGPPPPKFDIGAFLSGFWIDPRKSPDFAWAFMGRFGGGMVVGPDRPPQTAGVRRQLHHGPGRRGAAVGAQYRRHAAGLIGLGYGAFMSVDLALMTQVLPESLGESTGRDLGILTTAINIPQILSPVFAAWLLSISGHDYRSLFIASAAFIVAGSLFVLPIRSVR
jgi:MFS family permease